MAFPFFRFKMQLMLLINCLTALCKVRCFSNVNFGINQFALVEDTLNVVRELSKKIHR
jgi:hypothetical protein